MAAIPTAGPFLLDTGATIHVLTEHSLELHPITPQSIKGISDSMIYAMGIGKIKLTLGKGYHITLDDVLFMLNASICPILSALCVYLGTSLLLLILKIAG
jgi:hypothetical protein